jgi:predicted Rossmann fold nucleotide-binding protein DprA/Smf involved in DNA uptake
VTAISFTGCSDLRNTERKVVRATIEGLEGYPTLFFSGMAPGVDVYAAEVAMRCYPLAQHICLVPRWRETIYDPEHDCKHDRDAAVRLRKLAEKLDVEHLTIRNAQAGVGSEATGLLVRNDVLATACTHLVAFPRTGKEQQRSGTWSTVRRARRMGRPVLVRPLCGSAQYVLR